MPIIVVAMRTTPALPEYPRYRDQPINAAYLPHLATKADRYATGPAPVPGRRNKTAAIPTKTAIPTAPAGLLYLQISARTLSRRSNHFSSLTCRMKKPSPSSIVCAAQTSASRAVLSTLDRDILLHETSVSGGWASNSAEVALIIASRSSGRGNLLKMLWSISGSSRGVSKSSSLRPRTMAANM